MNSKNFKVYFDYGFSKIRAGAFNKEDHSQAFYVESEFFFDTSHTNIEIKKIITFLEKNTNEYVDDINLMVDNSKTLSVGFSVSKKLDGSKLRKEDVQFLIQDAKQQIMKSYSDHNIIHIIVNNYKINNIDYPYLPIEIKCNFISLDIFFICLPSEIIQNYKKIFHKFNISINQVVCSSYAKTINYKDDYSLNRNVTFIDVGFDRTSLISYIHHKIISIEILPIGGNHITQDISKILNVDIEIAENLKLNFNKNIKISNENNFSLEILQEIIFARIDELIKIFTKSIALNPVTADKFKIVLMGGGLKILDKKDKDNFFPLNEVVFLEENTKDICQAGFKLGIGLNKQEVVIIPNKQIKQGFFEKFFHFFK